MKLGIMSDLHMKDNLSWDFEPEEDVFYICAGDICEDGNSRQRWVQKHADHMFAINGNHDYFGGYFSDALYGTKLQEVDGVRIAGATLWTDLSSPLDYLSYCRNLIDDTYIKGITQSLMIETHDAHKFFLLNSEADVIVSHHTPSLQSVHKRFRYSDCNSSFSNNMDEEILKMKKPPKIWIHGHTHDRFDYMIGETRVICHPRGYKNELDDYMRYKPLIVEI